MSEAVLTVELLKSPLDERQDFLFGFCIEINLVVIGSFAGTIWCCRRHHRVWLICSEVELYNRL